MDLRDAQRVDRYNRVSVYSFVFLEPVLAVGLVSNIAVDTPASVLTALSWLAILHTLACFVLLRGSVRYRLADGPRPDAQRIAAGAVTVVGIVLVQVWREYLVLPSGEPDLGFFAILALLTFYGGTLAAGLPSRAGWLIALTGFVSVLVIGLVGGHAPAAESPAVVIMVLWSIAAILMASSFPTFVWISRVLLELDRARGTEARLAVAEERLRFARDLHDVLGRNLSVVALKSELAGRVAATDPEQAAAQMTEVREIADSSLKEVRDVVRGYRTTDLDSEFAGSRAVLQAAGVRCVVAGNAAGLSEPIQTALAWVVREGTTNVLRHSDATRCDLTLRQEDDTVVLTMENDGVRTTRPTSEGNGLIGLSERLAATGGTVATADLPGHRFRLTATIGTGDRR